MKNISTIILAFVLIFFTGAAFAQSQLKIGHVDIAELMSLLPERDSAQAVLDKETRAIEASFEEMQVVYNNLVEDYQKGLSAYSDLIKNAKEYEIIDKQKRLQEFEQNAAKTLQKRNVELFQPIYNKIIRTIEKVATENGFTYILDISKGPVVFTSKESQNINQLVIALLK